MIYCDRNSAIVPYLSAESKSREQISKSEIIIKHPLKVYSDFDFGDDRIDVMWPKILKRYPHLEKKS
jgi:hypothetical protein